MLRRALTPSTNSSKGSEVCLNSISISASGTVEADSILSWITKNTLFIQVDSNLFLFSSVGFSTLWIYSFIMLILTLIKTLMLFVIFKATTLILFCKNKQTKKTHYWIPSITLNYTSCISWSYNTKLTAIHWTTVAIVKGVHASKNKWQLFFRLPAVLY